MYTAIPKPDTSSGIISWVQNLFLSAATSPFVEAPRLLEFHNLNDETLQAFEDVDSGVGVEPARTVAEMVKKL